MLLIWGIFFYIQVLLYSYTLYYSRIIKSKILFLIFLTTLILEISSYILGQILGIHNLFLYHIETICLFVLYNSLIYKYTNILSRYFYIYANIIFIILAFASIKLFDPINTFNEVARTISAIWFISIGGYYFYNTISSDVIIDFIKQPIFWYISAIFIYFTLNIMLFATYNTTMYIRISEYIDLWIINNISLIIMPIMFFIGMRKEGILKSNALSLKNND